MSTERPALTCPDCGATMHLRPSRYGLFYGCERFPECRGTHGAHPDGRPLGKPATRETKNARIAAHAALDRLWLKGELTGKRKRQARDRAYEWLAERLGLDRDDCHVGEFDRETCERVVAACEGVAVADVLGAERIARYRQGQAHADRITGRATP